MSSVGDGSFRRISFIGMPLSNEEGRLKFVKEWMGSYFGGVTFSVGNVLKGPVKNRSLTSVTYVEFSDSDTRNFVLKKIKSQQPTCKYMDTNIVIKPALSQTVRERIWAFNTAYDLIKSNSLSSGKSVEKRNDKDRAVLVDGVIAFDQSSSSGLGIFVGSYVHLALPGRGA